MYQVTKTYGNEEGLSCVFRQWRAMSHCSKLHGYSLGFRFTFQCGDEDLTEEGWVIDFGGLDRLRQHLHETFDHKMILDRHDPLYKHFRDLAAGTDAIEISTFEEIGCEAFAKYMYNYTNVYVSSRIVSVECFEHKGNSAIYMSERK